MNKYIFIILLLFICIYNCHAQFDQSWLESQFIKGAIFSSLSANKNNIVLSTGFCETDSNKLDETFSFIEISTNSAINWNRIYEDRRKITNSSPEKFISSSLSENNEIFVLSDSGKVYISENLGQNWNIIKINEPDFKPLKIKIFKHNAIFIIQESGNSVIYSNDTLKHKEIRTITDAKTILDVQYFYPDSVIYLVIPNDTSEIERRFITSTDGVNWNNYFAPERLNKLNFFDFNYGILFSKKTYPKTTTTDLKINATGNNGKDLSLITTLPITANTEFDYDFIDFSNGMYIGYYTPTIYEFYDNLKNIYAHYLTGDLYYYGYGFEHLCYPDFNHAYISSNYHQRIFRFDRSLVSVIEDMKTEDKLIYPNPARDYIIIQPSEGWQPSEGSQIQIFSTFGETLLTVEHMSPSVQKIDISNLAPGMYFIKIGNRVEKFVKV